MNKHTILFLAANPLGTDRLALDREARAIQVELERSGHRDRFELVTRWAAEPLDLLRELRKLKPTVVHFSGHGGQVAQVEARPDGSAYRDVVVDDGRDHEDEQGGLFFQGSDGRPQRVSAKALQETFGAAGASVQVVVLNACYSSAQTHALLAHVDCVVGMHSAIRDDAARIFATGFYGGLGERESIAAAYRQGCAAISLEGLPDADRPQLAVRDGVDAEQLVLAADVPASDPSTTAAIDVADAGALHTGARAPSREGQLLEPLAGIGRPASSRIRKLMQEYHEALFAGRDRETAALHTWLNDPGAPLGLLAAAAGRGKSALLVRWSAEVVATGNTDLVYIPISIRFDTAHVAPVAKAIAGRLRQLMPGKQPIPVDDPFEALDECKDILGTDWSGRRPLLVILDGLDEAIGWKPSDLIPNAAGMRIKLLVAARGAAAHWMEHLSWTSPRSFVLEALDRPAVQALVASVPELQVVTGDDAAMERFQALTGGDPLVVQLHLRLVKQNNDGAAVQRFHGLLQGDLSGGDPLKRFFHRWWEEQRVQWRGQGAAITKTVECMLALLACAKGPLRLADLCALEDWEPEAVRESLAQLSRLVIVDPAGDRYVFGHSRLHDYFVEGLREAGRLESWKRRYLDYAARRFEELAAELPADAEDFTRRFGYVLYYYALHLQDDAPDRLNELMSRRWLEGWRRLEGDDGVYGGFYESVSRAEHHARTSRMLGEQTRALLIKASVTSLSSNVPPQLMRRLVETRLWPLSRALRVIDRMVNDDERASALSVLASGVEATGQGKILARAMNLSKGYRTRALASMMQDLAEIHREPAFEAILVDGTLLGWHSFVNLNRFVEVLSQDFAQRLLVAARAVAEPEQRLRALIAITESADSLPIEDRRVVLEECEHLVAKIESAEHRVHYRHEIASAATACAPEARPRLVRATLDEIRTLGIGDRAVINTLEKIADSADGMAPATRADIIAALWSAIDASDVPWLALSSLGPRLGRLGFASQVLERSGSITRDEHVRSMLLASLLPNAGDQLDRVWQSLWQLKRRDWVLQAMAPYIPQLSDEHRTAYLDEAFALVSRDPERSDLLAPIARWMVAGDRDVPRLLAAARALVDPTSRAMRLADCAHLVYDEERDGLVREILQGARDIAIREYKQRLLSQLARIIRTDQTLLLSTLAVSRQISDERLLVHAVERIAVTLGESGDGQAAVALAARAAGTFARHPGWVLEAHVRVVRALPEGDDKTALWNTAVDAARRLPSASGRAYFLAALAPIAPAPVKIEHTLAAWAAIQRLELPFERAYATVRLLRALDEDSRKDKLEWVIAQLSQDMSRWERFKIVRDLMSRLDDAELAMYRPTLDGSIDRVLRYNSVSDGESRGKDELNPLNDGSYIAGLAGFLDLGRARRLVARCPAEAVSTLELLALRVAELGQRDEALDAIRRLESPDSRARALARVLAHVPAADRAMLLAEACQNLEGAVDQSHTAEAEAFLVEHLTGAEREQRICAALQHAPSIRHDTTRHDTLHRLATSAATHLSFDRLDAIWVELLRRIAVQRREALVADLIALLPIVRRLAGNRALRTLGDTLLDVAEWFP